MDRNVARMKFMKRAMGAMDKPRLLLQGAPKYDKKLIQEIEIDQATHQLVDLVYAQHHDSTTPTCIMIHGGGLFYGDKTLNLNASVEMAKRGFNVINVDYPLIDTVSCLEQIQAILNVVAWLKTHHASYALNHEHVVMMGDSAGAYLSLVTSIILRRADLLNHFKVNPTLQIRGIGLICIMARLARNDSLAFVQHVAFKYEVDEQLKAMLLDPVPWIVDAPPCFVMGSQEDFLTQDTHDVIDTCQRTHHLHEVLFFEKGKSKPLLHVFPITFPNFIESQKVYDELAHFFHAHLHPNL